MVDGDLLTACGAALEVLCDRFGFEEPVLERIGRESFVRFHKGPRTVSIAHEPGGRPLVELFFPSSDTGEPPVPWAARGGVPRSRRIPSLAVHRRKRPRDFDELRSYLQEAAGELCELEHGFLSR